MAIVGPGGVPRLWPDGTIVCLGGGPSLVAADVEICRGRARVIAINDAYRIAPWADVLYSGDLGWLSFHRGAPGFAGLKFSIEPMKKRGDRDHQRWPDWTVMKNTGPGGIETAPDGLRTGHNSGAQAVNLAIHLGASRIVLLGYDMGLQHRQSHWFGEHPSAIRSSSPYHRFIEAFRLMAPEARALGVDVVNCSRVTRLSCFRRADLAEVFSDLARDVSRVAPVEACA